MLCQIAVLKVNPDYFSPVIGWGQALYLASAAFLLRVESTRRSIPGLYLVSSGSCHSSQQHRIDAARI